MLRSFAYVEAHVRRSTDVGAAQLFADARAAFLDAYVSHAAPLLPSSAETRGVCLDCYELDDAVRELTSALEASPRRFSSIRRSGSDRFVELDRRVIVRSRGRQPLVDRSIGE